MARFCPYRKTSTTETKPLYNADGERGNESTTTERFALCVEEACMAWDGGICTLIKQESSGR